MKNAQSDDERAALTNRYDAAKADALSRAAALNLEDFENAIGNTVAVIARSEIEVNRLANSDRQLYSTYYQQLEAGLRLPDGNEWDLARGLTDTLLFLGYNEQISFGALSVDGTGLSNYGSCSIVFRDEMIAHRTSVFEENSVMFTERQGIQLSRKSALPNGFRAVWSERAKLCVAKLAGRIDSTTNPIQYSGLLLKQGVSPEDDAFVEVHIFGPMTVLTFAKVVVTIPKTRPRATIVKALKSKLAKHGVSVN